jgi:type I restriction enzyme S subunit
MNAERLLEHYERVADAPDATQRLRRLILDLAVRGKLVPQDPEDEPASELLERITKEKARLVKAGAIRKPPVLTGIGEAETPFSVPSTWTWIRVGDIFEYDSGTKRDPKELQDRWLLELEDIEKDTSTVLVRLRVSDRDSLSTKSEFEVGDILYGKLRPYLNKVVVADEPGYSTTEIVAIRPFLKLCPAYCALAFRRPDFVAYVERLGRGTKMPRLRTPDAIVAAFPLPPLAEQHRIVAKVDALIDLCARVEAARAGREATRDRLAAASLARVNAPDPDTFQNDARFALDTLPALTTRPDQIKHLRQTILNLAVRGKLVPQDPNDEPASELLKRIEKAKRSSAPRAWQRRNGGGEDQESLAAFELPTSWKWTNLGALSLEMRYGTAKKCDYEPVGIPVLRIPNVSGGQISIEDLKFGPLTKSEIEQLSLRRGDLLVIRSNGSLDIVGRAAEVDLPAEGMSFAGYLVRVRLSVDNLVPRFVWFAMNTDHVRDQIERPIRSAVGLKNVNSTELAALSFPLPPLAEQHRIVTKVDALMALCDRLEANLDHTAATRRRLLDALLAEALAPGKERELAAAE